MNPPVFFGAGGVVVMVIAFGASFTKLAGEWFGAAQSFLSQTFGWFYVLAATALLIFTLYLLVSRFAGIKLGQEDDEPDFTRLEWLSMLFAAGMGMGLVFWGVAEPLRHYVDLPRQQAGSPDAIGDALRWTFYHWGLHPWAIYIVFGLSIAYFHFRHGQPLAPRSIFYGLFGKKAHGPMGYGVDILCTVGTLMGVATSLGLGAIQINEGLGRLAGLQQGEWVQIAIIGIITAVATISVVLGVKGGIRRLSMINILLAAALMAFVFLAGPTLFILNSFVSTTGQYLQHLPFMSFWVDLRDENDWQGTWTFFYWGWWFSWSPFVGIFTARISKGRTIREFILGVLLVPTVATFFWLSTFGGTALHLEAFDNIDLTGPTKDNAAISLHLLLEHLPWGSITGWFATLLITLFFITSSDSGSLVDDMVTSGGHPNPPTSQRLFWAISEGAMAATLLLAGGLNALQDAALLTGLPMAILLCAAGWALLRALMIDDRYKGEPATELIHEKRY